MRLLFFLILLVQQGAIFAQDISFPVEGFWLDDSEQFIVEVEVENGTCSGRIAWLAEPIDQNGEEQRDVLNKDPLKRSRKVMDIFVLRDFVSESSVWKSGKIYDHTSGNTYNARMEVDEHGWLRITGFYGLLFFLGKTKKWTRVTNPSDYGIN